ncbi:hypothetical protein TorRG33x02_011690 [Trema orientale]|uniref:Uncharacterized protein n=1 Tax=Trema orientale TaxID=63057 RepID=A0A2P5FZ87_TREOI|nr:hypothetical protein TorRG33x02_011690 [Trema orientale]
MDRNAPVARRTRAKEAEVFRALYEQRRLEKEREKGSSSNAGGSTDSGVVFPGEEDAGVRHVTNSLVDSVEGCGTRDAPFCIGGDSDDEDDSNDISGSEPEHSSDNDYEGDSSSDDIDDDDDDGDDSSDSSYDIDENKGKRHCRKRMKSRGGERTGENGEFSRRMYDGERDEIFGYEGGHYRHEFTGEVSHRRRDERRTNGEASVSGKERRSSGREASVSGSEFEAVGISEESFTGVDGGNRDESTPQKNGSVAQRTRILGSNSGSGSGKKRVGDGTVSQPFCIDYDEDDDDVVASDKSKEKEVLRKRGRPAKRKRNPIEKDDDVFKILVDSITGRRQVEDLVSQGDETPRGGGNMPQVEVELPLKFFFGIEEPKRIEKSDSELELEKLWEEFNLALAAGEIGSGPGDMDDEDEDAPSDDEADINNRCRHGKHHLILDEQIGLICTCCSHIQVEIKDILPSLDRNPWGRSDVRDHDPINCSIFDKLRNQDSDCSSNSGNNLCGVAETVWDLIPPKVRSSMHPHQREGFEFIWKKMAGGVDLQYLKGRAIENSSGGEGCIISHAPGTGKTLLTIVFLQTYMKLYPKCLPIIIAPRSMLLTWEEEFHKWKVDIPFHNLNLQELSGKEDEAALRPLKQGGRPGKDTIRVVKLISWGKGSSVLGMTYRLFEKLVAEEKTRGGQVWKILLDWPGLIVLDEGHTPRNKQSLIWKALSKVKTERRIVLSGTPFQNNFGELYNTLKLVRPRFAETISLTRDGDTGHGSKKEARNRKDWAKLTKSIGKMDHNQKEDDRVKEIRSIIDSVAHIHSGSVLESLPGLRDSVVVLKPTPLQESLLELERNETKKNNFEDEYKESLISVHPSLCLRTATAPLLHEKDKLERHWLNPDAGVKTRFLVELIRLSEAVNEKVLIFSQYIEPLSLVMAQLKSHFKWSEKSEIFYMDGKCDVKQRQSSINAFNDPSSKVRVLLASTKACAEGINLVGASRVVLLDIVWNPSVEWQAICRAYRLGQKKLVHVYHLITSSTNEAKKYSSQVEKDRLSKLVFSSSKGPSNHQKILPGVAEDRILEVMVKHEKLKDMFEKISFKESLGMRSQKGFQLHL